MKCTKANVQVTFPLSFKTSLIQMITNNIMSHKCVAQQVDHHLQELKNKGNDQLVIPKSSRGRLWMPGEVTCESF